MLAGTLATGGCQIYLSGGPGDLSATGARWPRETRVTRSYDAGAAEPDADARPPRDTLEPDAPGDTGEGVDTWPSPEAKSSERDARATPPPARTGSDSARGRPAWTDVADGAFFAGMLTQPEPPVVIVRPATYPGERHFRVGDPRVLVALARRVLEAADYRIVRAGTAGNGGEVTARRRAEIDPVPATTTSIRWRESAARVQVFGAGRDDCCYVRASFTLADLNGAENVLAVSPAHDPRVESLREGFLDEMTRRAAATPAR